MNKNINCGACEDLRENSASFVNNGVTKKVCTSLKNDTGFNPDLTTPNTDCEDLDTANDCMIGMMEPEIDAYGLCDWKDFTKKFIGNLHQFLKATICAICGLWENVHELWCMVNFLFKGKSFSVGESTTGDAYAVAGKGVSFLIPMGGSEHTSDLGVQYIAGGLMRGTGSYRFYTDAFTDQGSCGHFDNGGTMQVGSNRLGNAWWDDTHLGRPAEGGELICEFRIKKTKYPQLKHIFNGFGQETGGGAYHVQAIVFDGDNTSDSVPTVYAYGQHGWCHENGTKYTSADAGYDDTYDPGHAVPKGWFYIQIRLTYAFLPMGAKAGRQRSPLYFMGIRMNQDEIEC